MFEKLDIPVFGMIENMSYFIAPDTGNRYDIFGHGGAEKAMMSSVSTSSGNPNRAAVREGADAGTPIVYVSARQRNRRLRSKLSRATSPPGSAYCKGWAF